MASPNIGEILATTLNAYGPQLTDAIYTGTKTLRALTMKEGVKKKQDGGATIRESIEYGQNGTVKAMAEYDNYTIAANQVFDAAEFPWAEIAGTVTFTKMERTKNSGKQAIFNLLESKMENLKKDLRFTMNSYFFTGDGVLQPVGSQSVISTTGTYGGIPRSGNTWWQGQVDADAEQLTVSDLRHVWNLAHANSDTQPDLIACDVDLFEYYEDLVVQHALYGNMKSGDLGFQSLKFKGSDMFWDTHVPNSEIHILNSAYWRVWCHPQFEFSVQEPIRPDQALEIYPVHWHGNYTCRGPRFQGRLTGKTPTP